MPSFALCDVFTDRPFCGNPLAVFLDADDVSEQLMGALAKEFGWSEVAFVLGDRLSGTFRVRIWTPQGELPFAGHPTIGTAVVLASLEQLPIGDAVLELGIGPVAVHVHSANAGGGSATMHQRVPEFGGIWRDRDRLARALGLPVSDFDASTPAQMVSTGAAHFMVPVRSLAALQSIRPNSGLLLELLAEMGARWAYVFTTDIPGTSVAARARLVNGSTEDAATGGAAGPLGAYLVRYGLRPPGKMDIEQGFEMGRPSLLQVEVALRHEELEAVRVTGSVRIWSTGTMNNDVLQGYA